MSNQEKEQGGNRPSGGLPLSVNELLELLRGLFDFQFSTIITTRMLPVVYALAVCLTAISTIYLIGWAFTESWQFGLVWLFLAGPTVFLAVVITIRVLLEFFISFFRLVLYIEGMQSQIEGIAGQTDDIAEGLPRIVFWRKQSKDKTDKDKN